MINTPLDYMYIYYTIYLYNYISTIFTIDYISKKKLSKLNSRLHIWLLVHFL